MKTASAGLITHLAGYGTTLALCIKARREDGTIYGWTDHDRALSVNLSDGDGALSYSPSEGFERAAIRTSAGLRVDETEAASFFISAGLTKEDLRAGRWDFANLFLFLVNWQDTTQILKLRRGKLGRVTARDDAFAAEIRSLFELYNQELVRLYHPACGVELGSSISQQGGGCGVPLPPSAWQANTAYTVRSARDAASGSVVRPTVFNDRQYRCITVTGSPPVSGGVEPVWPTGLGSPLDTIVDGAITWQAEQALYLEARVVAVTSLRVFALDYTGSASATRITGGRLTFTSGLNIGTTHEIKRYTISGAEVELYLPTPFNINAGSPNDSVTIKLSCDKSLATCRDFFDNVENFQGYPHIPGNDFVFRTPDAV